MMNAGINASLAILLSFFISFMEELSEMKLTRSRTIILISGLILIYLLLKDNVKTSYNKQKIELPDNLNRINAQTK
tara:strand:+ start:207 stop:434 length:228 start_codon:yes stop_codon:yes gene_type:complete